MREETLKSLVHLTDKLDERNMQEKLVRCITGLQADSEASIRTNSVIFLGRIANRLKEGVRLRVLSVSFVKAMKDPFLHCRLAGLRASLACLNLLDGPQIAGKLLPQVCLLTLDRVAESRELALTVLEQSTAQLRRLSEELKRAEAEQKRLGIESGAANKPAENEASWSIMGLSWGAAAVDGLAKTIEKTVLQNPTADDDVRPSSTSVKSSSSSHVQVASPKKTMSSTSGQSLIPPATTSITQKATSNIVRDTWDEDFDIPDEGDVDHSDGEDEPRSKGAGLKLDNNRKPVVRNGWDDFDDDFDDDKFDEKPAKQIIPMTQKTSSSDAVSPTSKAVCIEPDIVPCKVADNSPIAKTTGAIPTKGKGSSAKKPVVKLTKDKNESWDDF